MASSSSVGSLGQNAPLSSSSQEAASVSNWALTALRVAHLALPTIEIASFSLAMVSAYVFPPAALLFVAIGVAAGVSYALLPAYPGSYRSAQGENPNRTNPSQERSKPKTYEELAQQQVAEEKELKKKQAERREKPEHKDLGQALGEVEKLENKRQKIELAIGQKEMDYRAALEKLEDDRKKAKEKQAEGTPDYSELVDLERRFDRQRDELEQAQKEELQALEDQLQKAKLAEDLEFLDFSLEKGHAELKDFQKRRADHYRGIEEGKDPQEQKIGELNEGLHKLDGVEEEQLNAGYNLEKVQIENKDRYEIERLAQELAEAQKAVNEALQAVQEIINPSTFTRVQRGMHAVVSSANRARIIGHEGLRRAPDSIRNQLVSARRYFSRAAQPPAVNDQESSDGQSSNARLDYLMSLPPGSNIPLHVMGGSHEEEEDDDDDDIRIKLESYNQPLPPSQDPPSAVDSVKANTLGRAEVSIQEDPIPPNVFDSKRDEDL